MLLAFSKSRRNSNGLRPSRRASTCSQFFGAQSPEDLGDLKLQARTRDPHMGKCRRASISDLGWRQVGKTKSRSPNWSAIHWLTLDSLDFSVIGILCFTFDRSSTETSRAWRGEDRTGLPCIMGLKMVRFDDVGKCWENDEPAKFWVP